MTTPPTLSLLRVALFAVVWGCSPSDSSPEPVQSTTTPIREGKLPCAVEKVLIANCGACHSVAATLPVRTPFVLEHYADTQKTTSLLGTKNQPIWQAIAEVVRKGSMPLSTSPPYSTPAPLLASDAQILLDWTDLGANPVPLETDCK